MTDTPLDRARRAITANPEDETARLAWYHAFASTEVCVLLEEEPQGDDLSPRLFSLEEGLFLLAFDSEERLAAFTESVLPYAALPGRVIAGLLAGQGVGIAVNPGEEESAFLMSPQSVDWLARLLAEAPQASAVLPTGWSPPATPGLAATLAERLWGFGARAERAWLARGTFADGQDNLLLVIEDAAPEARAALAKAAGEALAFAGVAGDVLFLTASEARNLVGCADPVALSRPAPPPPPSAPAAPGSDPARPPRLR